MPGGEDRELVCRADGAVLGLPGAPPRAGRAGGADRRRVGRRSGCAPEGVGDGREQRPVAAVGDVAPGRCAPSHVLVAVHVLLGVDDGAFVSMLDPGEGAEVAVAGCAGDGTWPVLIGDDDRVMLAAPIILYDHPQIAPESERRSLRRHRDRRDPRAAHPDPDRRREGGGESHRPACGGDRRPHRRHDAGCIGASARHDARAASGSALSTPTTT